MLDGSSLKLDITERYGLFNYLLIGREIDGTFLPFQAARQKTIEENQNNPMPSIAAATVPDTDGEHDELEDDIVVTHMWNM